MNYELIYNRFIDSRKPRDAGETVYYEKHHIIPRSLGGSNDNENLIKLTAREHYFAHLLLAKFAGPKMVIALSYFITGDNRYGGGVKYIPSSRKIGKIMEEANKARSKILTGRKFSDEHRKNLSKGKKGIPAHNKGKPRSEESNKKQSDSMKGKPAWNKNLTGEQYKSKYKNGGLKPPNMTGYKWINNGIKQTKLAPNNEIPEGWSFGRLDNRGDNNRMRKKNVI
jgi:hypothetical protein